MNELIKKIDTFQSIMDKYLSHWNIDKVTKRMIAMDYIKEYGLKDVVAFVDFCKRNNMTDDITPTLAHDINGMKDRCFLPRTSGYSKEAL